MGSILRAIQGNEDAGSAVPRLTKPTEGPCVGSVSGRPQGSTGTPRAVDSGAAPLNQYTAHSCCACRQSRVDRGCWCQFCRACHPPPRESEA